MSDERQERDFYARDEDEQLAFLKNTWCNHCQEVDLGMSDPAEFFTRRAALYRGPLRELRFHCHYRTG